MFSVRTSAQKYDIQFGKVNVISGEYGNDFCLDSAPVETFSETLDISRGLRTDSTGRDISVQSSVSCLFSFLFLCILRQFFEHSVCAVKTGVIDNDVEIFRSVFGQLFNTGAHIIS